MLESDYHQRLDEIANRHLSPDQGQKVDVKLRSCIRDRMMKWVTGPDILEFGAGELMWTSEIINAFGHSSIVDGSEELLRNAETTYGGQVTCYKSLFETFVPPAGKLFNTIVATHVLEHVTDPVLVIRQAKRGLAPGGRMIVAVPNAASLHRRLGVKMGALKTIYDFSERDLAHGHQRVYDLEQLKSNALSAGMNIVHVQGFFLKILSVGQMADFPDVLIRGLFDLGDELPPEMMSDIGLVLEVPEGTVS